MIRKLGLLTLLVLPTLILSSLNNGSAAFLTFSSLDSNLSTSLDTISAEKVKPSQCDDLSLDNSIVTGSGAFTDTTGNSSLLIGDGGSNSLYGQDGDDCMIAVDGDDMLIGGSGSDICLGGDGDDDFKDCETCYGGNGSDTDLTGSCTITNSIEAP